jgi:hypothetical protein
VLITILLQFSAVREAFGIRMPTAAEVALVLGFGIAVMVSIEFLKAGLASRKARTEAFVVSRPI